MNKKVPKSSGEAVVEELHLIPRAAGATTESAFQQSISASTAFKPIKKSYKPPRVKPRVLKKKAKAQTGKVKSKKTKKR